MPAFNDFTSGIQEVRTLLSLCKSDGRQEGSLGDVTVNAVCRAAAVLLVSHFESFLKTTAEEFVDAIATGDIASRAIPVGVRELHSLPRMEEILSANDAKQRVALLGKMAEYNCLWVADAKPPPQLLKSDILRRVVTNPDSLVIDKLFGLMGAANPVCDGDIDVEVNDQAPPAPVNIRLMLRTIVKCRNDIAHGDITRIPTSEDVDRYIRQLEALARRLEARATLLAENVRT
jgi:hypothetical protein